MDLDGKPNPLVEAVKDIDILGGFQRDPREEELDRIRGEKVADSIEDDPRFSRVAADPGKGVEASNPDGSFEAMARLFGGGGMGPAPMPGMQQALSSGGGG